MISMEMMGKFSVHVQDMRSLHEITKRIGVAALPRGEARLRTNVARSSTSSLFFTPR